MKKANIFTVPSFPKADGADGSYICPAFPLTSAVKSFISLHFPKKIEIISRIKKSSTLHIKLIPKRLAELLSTLLRITSDEEKLLVELTDMGDKLKLQLKLKGKPFGKEQINLIKDAFGQSADVTNDKSIVVHIAHSSPTVITTSALVFAFIREELERIFFG